MRAHVLKKYSKAAPQLSFDTVAQAPLEPHEVRVAVEAVALNPVDLKTCEGEPRLLLPMAPPFVLGVDLAGRVTELGASVTSLRRGDLVYAYTGMDRMGAFAESVVLPADRVARRAEGLHATEAACLPLPALCALQALDAGNVRPGHRVLIHGATGGVGSLAVQLAVQRGAEVFGTVGPADLERARALGVAHPIDYRSQRFEDVARGLDWVFDTVGGDTLKRSWATVRPGGVVASLHVPPPAEALVAARLRAPLLLRAALPFVTRGAYADARKAGAALRPILTTASATDLERVTEADRTHGLRVTVDRTFAFDALSEAILHLRSGNARGRVVLSTAGG